MIRLIFALAFLLGAAAVVSMSAVFVGSDSLALTVTLVIGAVYTIGTIELLQFQKATNTLSGTLSSIPEKLESIDSWLAPLHHSLKNSVRLRIEGERNGLPSPVLTPYLVSLLVMLGLLGTFFGMVDTLQGAVVALQGTTELEAIRDGLAAPIKGLGLAFGTSVAGVAASAMLGLMSTLSRRERVFATRELDAKITTVFRDFSLTHNRQETYKALQGQAKALPAVANQLQSMAEKLTQMGDKLGEQLNAKQDNFHHAVKQSYEELAASVATSLKESLSESGRIAGESIQPIMRESVAGISQAINDSAVQTHAHLTQVAQNQLENLSGQFSQTAGDVKAAWTSGLAEHTQSNQTLISDMDSRLENLTSQFGEVSSKLLGKIEQTQAEISEKQMTADSERLQLWSDSFDNAQKQSVSAFSSISDELTEQLKEISSAQQSVLEKTNQDFSAMSSNLTEQWQQAGEKTLSEQERISQALSATSSAINQSSEETANKLLSEMSRLFDQSQQQSVSDFTSLSERFTDQLKQVSTAQQSVLEKTNQDFSAMSSGLTEQWQQAGEKTLHEQEKITQALSETANTINQSSIETSGKLLTDMTRLFESSERMVEAREVAEAQWLASHQARMEALSQTVGNELSRLRDEEQQRADSAVAHLGQLEQTASTHLASLGKALEEPMKNLIETASETPKAAAEVITKLREEMSNNIERDNSLLEERSRIMAELDTVSGSLSQSSSEQREAIEQLVQASTSMLEKISVRFDEHVDTEVSKLSDIAAGVSGSAIEMASLGDAFTLAVQLFNDSNDKLIDNLQRIESALDQSSSRSDEQLGYYVAQAREIIDHSMMSQKALFEEVRQLSSQSGGEQ